MGVDDRGEVEGRGGREGFGGVDFEAVVIGGACEGKGVKGKEGERCYAVLVGGYGSSSNLRRQYVV